MEHRGVVIGIAPPEHPRTGEGIRQCDEDRRGYYLHLLFLNIILPAATVAQACCIVSIPRGGS
jgi:hypothetical protein